MQSGSANNPIRVLALACALTFAVLAGLSWSLYDSHRFADHVDARIERTATLRGEILHLDELLTMTARMAAATGDPQWARRYNLFEPRLDPAIKEAVAIEGSHGSEPDAAAATDLANLALVAMEREAFSLVERGESSAAQALLSSAEYERQKQVYAQGMTDLGNRLQHVIGVMSDARSQRTIRVLAILVLVLMVTFCGWIVVWRMLQVWQARLIDSNQHLLAKGRELRDAKTAAESANRAKSTFLANMSHEIRTPMTAILGFAEDMLAPDQPESQRHECIQTIHRNGEHLLTLLNDILDLSRIEADRMQMDLARCAPCLVVAEVASLMRVRSDAKGLRFSVEYLSAIPEAITSDAHRLRQILINLLDNAIKFTAAGSTRLLVRCLTDDGAPRLQFDVVDTGIGLGDDQRALLFKPFSQADASTTRRFGGTGLGLTICKRLATLLGGDVVILDSAPGSGTTVRLSIATGPLDGVAMLNDPHAAAVVADTAAPADLPVAGGVRVLLAEDGPDNQRLISLILSKAGMDVCIEPNGQRAINAALAADITGHPFDVILMDMQMPVLDGYSATSILRQHGYTAPIIALTAHAMDSDREKCLKVGCDDYLSKPIDRATLIRTIRHHAAGRAAAESLRDPAGV